MTPKETVTQVGAATVRFTQEGNLTEAPLVLRKGLHLTLADKLNLLIEANAAELDDFQRLALRLVQDGQLQLAVSLLSRKAQDLPYTSTKAQGDMVNRPDHYARWKLEPTTWAREYDVDWNVANFVKYIFRYMDKFKPREDVMKAARYLVMEGRFRAGSPWWSQ